MRQVANASVKETNRKRNLKVFIFSLYGNCVTDDCLLIYYETQILLNKIRISKIRRSNYFRNTTNTFKFTKNINKAAKINAFEKYHLKRQQKNNIFVWHNNITNRISCHQIKMLI